MQCFKWRESFLAKRWGNDGAKAFGWNAEVNASHKWQKKKKTLTKPVRAFKMDNDKHLSQPIPGLQFVGWNRTIWFPGSGPNPVHSETGGWQPDVCSPQLQFCLSGWIRSSFSEIMFGSVWTASRESPRRGGRAILTVSLQTKTERERPCP